MSRGRRRGRVRRRGRRGGGGGSAPRSRRSRQQDWSKDAVITGEVRAWARHQGHQAFDQFVRGQDERSRSVTPGTLQVEAQAAVGHRVKAVGGDGRARQVPAMRSSPSRSLAPTRVAAKFARGRLSRADGARMPAVRGDRGPDGRKVCGVSCVRGSPRASPCHWGRSSVMRWSGFVPRGSMRAPESSLVQGDRKPA